MNRRSTTFVIVVALCVVWFAYGQGWLHWSRTGADIESNKDGPQQTMDQQEMNDDAVQVTPTATEPAATPKE